MLTKYPALLFSLAASLLLVTGCSQQRYASGPPPPPPGARDPLRQMAFTNGERDGHMAGRRDAERNLGYHPKKDRLFSETPGYDPRFGPAGAYRNAYRDAFLRAYDMAYHRN